MLQSHKKDKGVSTMNPRIQGQEPHSRPEGKVAVYDRDTYAIGYQQSP